MLIFGILMVIVIIAIIVMAAIERDWDIGDFAGNFLLFTVFAATIALINMCVCTGVMHHTDNKSYETVQVTEITALNDGSAVSGHSFLGTGSVDEQMRYYFMKDTELGAHMDYVYASNSYIVENNSENPRVEKKKIVPNNFYLRYNCYSEYVNIIYVPVDSVTTEFTVDMQ